MLFCRIIAIIGSVCGVLMAQERVTITVADTATVKNSRITVRDIAVVTTEKSETKSIIDTITVGDAAPAGFNRFVNGEEGAAAAIRRLFPNIVVSVKGAPRVRVTTLAQERMLSEFHKEIADYVADKLSWPKADCTIEIPTDRSLKFLPGKITVIPEGTIPPNARGSLPIRVKFVCQGFESLVSAVVRITVTTTVVTAGAIIDNGHSITQADLKLEKADITNISRPPFTSLKEVIGLAATRTIVPGTVITPVFVKRDPDIKRGENIRMSFARGGIQLTVDAIARENGAIGDEILVENLSSRKIIKCRIMAKGSVSVSNQS